MDVAEIITKRIIDKLEEGVVPWKRPWNGRGVPTRWSVNKPYRGINLIILPPGEYASRKQILTAGGRIKKEEMKNSYISVYWHWFKVKAEGQEDVAEEDAIYKQFAKPYYYKVWEINTQCTGLKSKAKVSEDGEPLDFNPVDRAEELIEAYIDAPEIKTGSGAAYYVPALDYISLPPVIDFISSAEYYSTKFHELIHSTGHAKRLNREGITVAGSIFGSDTYSKEELVAELGAAMLCTMSGIDNDTIDNSASYINGWLNKLKGDKKFIFSAASQAQKAVDLITGGMTFEDEGSESEEETQPAYSYV